MEAKKEQNELNEVKEIRLIANEVNGKDGKKWVAFKAVKKDGKLIDCRFRRDCNMIPTESCIIVVDVTKINIATNRLYPVLWVENILEIRSVKDNNTADNRLNEMF